MLARLKAWARAVKRDTVALWIAARDARTPVAARVVAALVAAYALSPIDLIPDFIPLLGYLDDAVIVPLGILLTVWLVPEPLMREFRARAADRGRLPGSRAAAVAVVAAWAACGVWLATKLYAG